jgi:hypothetical protein
MGFEWAGLPPGVAPRLMVVDLQGRKVKAFSEGDWSRKGPEREAGRWTLLWDATDEKGRPLPRGMYALQAQVAGGGAVARKFIR